MKASELRIGDLVLNNYEGLIEKGRPVKVATLSSWDFQNTTFINSLRASFFEPIPLTEEWLIQTNLKNTVGNEWSYYDEETEQLFVIEKMHDGFFYYTGGEGVKLSRKIESMHHLQNLYHDIMGQELTFRYSSIIENERK